MRWDETISLVNSNLIWWSFLRTKKTPLSQKQLRRRRTQEQEISSSWEPQPSTVSWDFWGPRSISSGLCWQIRSGSGTSLLFSSLGTFIILFLRTCMSTLGGRWRSGLMWRGTWWGRRSGPSEMLQSWWGGEQLESLFDGSFRFPSWLMGSSPYWRPPVRDQQTWWIRAVDW